MITTISIHDLNQIQLQRSIHNILHEITNFKLTDPLYIQIILTGFFLIKKGTENSKKSIKNFLFKTFQIP